jgi:hypothetical protein
LTETHRVGAIRGLLLAPHLDAAFDRGFITAEDNGKVKLSPRILAEDPAILGLGTVLRIETHAVAHRPYLVWHREKLFQDPAKESTR